MRRVGELGMSWLGGFALAVTLLIVAAGVGSYFFTYRMQTKLMTMKTEMGNEIVKDIAEAREKGEVTPEEEGVVSELAQSLGQGRQRLAAMQIVRTLLKRFKTGDGEQRQAIIQCLGEFNTYFKDNPNASDMQFLEFMDKIPYMDEAMCGDASGEGEGEVIAVPGVADSPTPDSGG